MKTTDHFPLPLLFPVSFPFCFSDRNVHGQSDWGVSQVQKEKKGKIRKNELIKTLFPFCHILLLHRFHVECPSVCVCVCVGLPSFLRLDLLLQSNGFQCLQVFGFGFSLSFWVWGPGPIVGPSVVRSILITLIKVLPSLVFFTPFLTNYAGISCFRFCSWPKSERCEMPETSGLNSCSFSAPSVFLSPPSPLCLSFSSYRSLSLSLSLSLCVDFDLQFG